MNRAAYFRLLGFIALLAAQAVSAQEARNTETEQTYFDFQVDQAARIKSNRTPVYPERLRAANQEGSVLVQFVVDERGIAQMNTFKVIKSTDNELTLAVRRAVASTTYYPAEARGQKVRQLVQQPFTFSAAKQYGAR